MTRQVAHYALRGGLDLVSSPLTIDPGRLWRSLNVEPAEAGYRRIAGYERFDGRPAPSDAAYWMIGRDLKDSQSDPDVGDTVTGADSGATGKLLKVADDEYVLGEVSGTFGSGEDLEDGIDPFGFRLVVAEATTVARKFGAATIDDDLDYRDLAAAARRADIAKVPGSGPVRGVWAYAGDVFAVRNNDAATVGVMHRATASGWTAVAGVTLPAGGTYRFINHNFMGQAATLTMYGVNGVGKAFSVLKGGTVDSPTYTSASLTTGQTDDEPTHIAVQNHHLVLAFRGGSLALSATGDPADYTAANGAAEIACGQDVNGLLGGVGLGNTIIMGEDHIQVLYGNDSTDFVLQDQSQSNTGGVANTLQSVGGPIYLDNRGVRSLTTTEAWGNWVIGTMTADVQPWIDLQREARNVAAGSMRIRSSDQYRLWFASGLGLIIYVGRGRPEMSFIDYGADSDGKKIIPKVSVSAEDSDRIERVYFGADNGFVYEAERGRSFDGRELESYARLPLNHVKQPSRQKRFHAVDLHVDIPHGRVNVALSAIFEGVETIEQKPEPADVFGGGALWDEAIFDEFTWNAPLNGFHRYGLTGIGRTASVLLLSRSAKEGTVHAERSQLALEPGATGAIGHAKRLLRASVQRAGSRARQVGASRRVV